jgi:SAM-dependent methyltransferase
VGSFHQAGELSTLLETRAAVAAVFLRGEGIEVGALHQPLKAPAEARVRYVDRMPTAQLRAQYPELGDLPLIEPDIIDNGETLTTLPENSQDFVVGNHFLEHCQDPFRTLQNIFRVLRPGGVLFMAVPDKRFSFDADRPCTTLAHLDRDYAEGPAWSKRDHFEEWSRLVNKRTDPALVAEEIVHLMNIDYSIHYHVWGAAELIEFLQALHRYVGHELEMFIRSGPENIFVLRRV